MNKSIFRRLTILCLLFSFQSVLAEPIWIDVRSIEENAEDHIEGDVNIPIGTLNSASLAAQYGKDAEIQLYCRSGGRAGKALSQLEAAGFTNVSNAGGIDDVRALRELAQFSSTP